MLSCTIQIFPTHLPGVCDITRCLYDPSLYTISTDATSTLDTPQQRILAVADLQDPTDFELLYRLTSYRQEHQLGNTEEMLNLTKNTITYIANKPTISTTPTTTTDITVTDTTNTTTSNTDTTNPDTSKDAYRFIENSEIESGYSEQEWTFSCINTTNTITNAANTNTVTNFDNNTILRIAIFISNLSIHTTTTTTTSILQLIQCELYQHHIIEVFTLTTITDRKLLAALRRLGITVQFFPGDLSQSSIRNKENNTNISEIVSYLSTFDVIVIVPTTGSGSSDSSANTMSTGSISGTNSTVETSMIQTLLYQLTTTSTTEQYRVVLLHTADSSSSEQSPSTHYLSALDFVTVRIIYLLSLLLLLFTYNIYIC